GGDGSVQHRRRQRVAAQPRAIEELPAVRRARSPRPPAESRMAVPRACFGCTPFASRTRVRSRSGVDCVEELCFGAACLLVDPGRLGVVVAGAPGEGPRTANEGASGDAEAPGASDAISDPATARAATEAPTRDVRNGPP